MGQMKENAIQQNEDLLIMEDEEMESFVLGMWQGVESFIREQEDK